MAIPVLIMGKSGTGKSYSLRNCVDNDNWQLIKVLGKPLPFRGKIAETCTTDNYKAVSAALKNSKANSAVIDDAGYLITNQFMRNHAGGTGNAVFTMYNKLADNFWRLIDWVITLPEDKIVYVIMHEDRNDFGDIKPKTIGKLLDEKVCIEGMFAIVLHSVQRDGGYYFVTQSADGAVSKSPVGMFNSLEIDNDITIVDRAIRDYYEMTEKEEKTNDK